MVESVKPTLPAPKTAEAGPASLRVPTKLLNQSDFLKLLVTQLSHQDPLKPVSDTEFVAQMTQFTALEQAKNMQADISQMRSQQKMLQAMAMLDREVVVQSKKAGLVAGVVKGFDMEGDEPKLIVGSEKFNLNDIVTIRLATQAGTGGAATKSTGEIVVSPNEFGRSAPVQAPEAVADVSSGADPSRNEAVGALAP